MVAHRCSMWLPTPEADFLLLVLANVGQEGSSAPLAWAVGVLLLTNASLIVAPRKVPAASRWLLHASAWERNISLLFTFFSFFAQNGCLELQKRLEGESRRNPEERKYFGKSLTATFSFYLVGPKVSSGFSIVEMCERVFGPAQHLLWASSVLFQIFAVGSLIHQFSASFLSLHQPWLQQGALNQWRIPAQSGLVGISKSRTCAPITGAPSGQSLAGTLVWLIWLESCMWSTEPGRLGPSRLLPACLSHI